MCCYTLSLLLVSLFLYCGLWMINILKNECDCGKATFYKYTLSSYPTIIKENFGKYSDSCVVVCSAPYP